MSTESAEKSAPPMPEWAPKDGPWCLKQWLPLRLSFGEEQKIDTCLRELDHTGECRGIHGVTRNYGNSAMVAQLKPKPDA